MVVKERSRDSAWFSILDGEWPALKAAFERGLDVTRFEAPEPSLHDAFIVLTGDAR